MSTHREFLPLVEYARAFVEADRILIARSDTSDDAYAARHNAAAALNECVWNLPGFPRDAPFHGIEGHDEREELARHIAHAVLAVAGPRP